MTKRISLTQPVSLLAALLLVAVRASAQETPYPLGTLPPDLTVQWPAAPRITRSVDVSTLLDFNRAAAVAGTLITITAVISGRGTISASDIEVRMEDDASLGGLYINRALKRIALYGGRYTGTVEIALPSVFWPVRIDNPAWVVEDVMIDGIDVRSTTRTALFLRGHRVALLRSTVYAADYAVWSDTIAQDQTSSLIIAGNDLKAEGREATVRMLRVLSSVSVDNRLTNLLLTGTKHNFRVHGVCGRVFAARNVLVNSGVMLGTGVGDDIAFVGFDANTFHHKTPDLFNVDRVRVRVLHAHDNLAYTDVWKCFVCGSVPATWDLANNVVLPFKPAAGARSGVFQLQPGSATRANPRRWRAELDR